MALRDRAAAATSPQLVLGLTTMRTASLVAPSLVLLVLCMLQVVAAWPTGAGRFVAKHPKAVARPVADSYALKTNAERFAFGLPPLPPRRRYGTSPSRRGRSIVISADDRL